MRMFIKIMIIWFGNLPVITDLYTGHGVTLTDAAFVLAACWLVLKITDIEVAQEIKETLEKHHIG